MDGLKARLSFDAVAYDYDNEYLTIDTDTHTININNVSRLFGVQYDGNSKLIKFRIRNKLSDIQKMQDSIVYINWIDSRGVKGQSIAINKTINNDTCEFAWKVPFDALKNSGVLHFAMSAVMTKNSSSVIDRRWSTQIASVITPDGIYIKSYIPSSEEEDRIAQIYNELSNMINKQNDDLRADIDVERKRIDVLNNGGLIIKDELIENNIKTWLDEHPEATTTVQDGSIDKIKIKTDFLSKIQNQGLNIKEKYNIDNTGNTDVTSVLQEALDNAEDGDCLYLPKGTYLISKGLKINKVIELVGEASMKRPANTSNNPTNIKLVSSAENITAISKGTAERCTLRNIAVSSESFYITRNNTIPSLNNPNFQIEGHVEHENVNGIDMHDFNGAYLYNCNAYGFSGFGIKTSHHGIADSIWVHYSNNGIIAYNDCMHNNIFVQDCINGITLSGNAIIINGFRCDEISEYGLIISGQQHFINAGFIDQCGYSAISTEGYVSDCYVNVKILRSCGYWYLTTYESINKSDEHFKDFFRIQINGSFNYNNVIINMNDLCGLNDKVINTFSPAYIYTNDVEMYNNEFKFNNNVALSQKVISLKISVSNKNTQRDNLSKYLYKPSTYNKTYTMQILLDSLSKSIMLGSDNSYFDDYFLRNGIGNFVSSKHTINNSYSKIEVINNIAIFTLQFTANENISPWTSLGIEIQNATPNNIFRIFGETSGNPILFTFSKTNIQCGVNIEKGKTYTVSGIFTVDS